MNIEQIKARLSLENNSKEEEIEAKQAKKAYLLLKTMALNTKEDYFLFLSAINLLNAYTKKDYATDEFKKAYSHKQYIEQAINSAIMDEKEILTFSHNKDGKGGVLIVNIDDVQFSFHSVLPSAKMQLVMRDNLFEHEQEKWSGIRLQPVASSLFEDSIKLNNLSQQTIVGCTVKALLDEVDEEFAASENEQTNEEKIIQEDQENQF
jgi:hypothetical protein